MSPRPMCVLRRLPGILVKRVEVMRPKSGHHTERFSSLARQSWSRPMNSALLPSKLAYNQLPQALSRPSAFTSSCTHPIPSPLTRLPFPIFPPPPLPLHLLDFTLEILPRDQIRDIIIVLIVPPSQPFPLPARAAVLLLQALVALGQLAEGGQAVGAELVEDAGDEFREFFVFAGAVDGEGVGGDGGVDCGGGLGGAGFAGEEGGRGRGREVEDEGKLEGRWRGWRMGGGNGGGGASVLVAVAALSHGVLRERKVTYPWEQQSGLRSHPP